MKILFRHIMICLVFISKPNNTLENTMYLQHSVVKVKVILIKSLGIQIGRMENQLQVPSAKVIVQTEMIANVIMK